MNQTLQQVLAAVAKAEGKTPDYIYRKIQEAINDAQKSTDPLVQERWKNFPKKGELVTVEEFFAFFDNNPF